MKFFSKEKKNKKESISWKKIREKCLMNVTGCLELREPPKKFKEMATYTPTLRKSGKVGELGFVFWIWIRIYIGLKY